MSLQALWPLEHIVRVMLVFAEQELYDLGARDRSWATTQVGLVFLLALLTNLFWYLVEVSLLGPLIEVYAFGFGSVHEALLSFASKWHHFSEQRSRSPF
jgi:hypothetical protein